MLASVSSPDFSHALMKVKNKRRWSYLKEEGRERERESETVDTEKERQNKGGFIRRNHCSPDVNGCQGTSSEVKEMRYRGGGGGEKKKKKKRTRIIQHTDAQLEIQDDSDVRGQLQTVLTPWIWEDVDTIYRHRGKVLQEKKKKGWSHAF